MRMFAQVSPTRLRLLVFLSLHLPESFFSRPFFPPLPAEKKMKETSFDQERPDATATQCGFGSFASVGQLVDSKSAAILPLAVGIVARAACACKQSDNRLSALVCACRTSG